MADLPVDFILFTHLPGRNPRQDLQRTLGTYAAELQTALCDGKHGVLFVFYDPGWLELLQSLGPGFDAGRFVAAVERAEKARRHARQMLEAYGDLKDRVRFVTAGDLYPIINKLRTKWQGEQATRLRRFLAGDAVRSQYETPKIVEAFIRLRHLGAGIPVLRIDADALFNDITLGKPGGGGPGSLTAAVNEVLAHHDRVRDVCGGHFLVSGSYRHPEPPLAKWSYQDWRDAFATRALPALRATADVLNAVGFTWEKPSQITSQREDILAEAFDPGLMRQFFGLREDAGGGLTVANAAEGDTFQPTGITALGAHPLKAVISGALMGMGVNVIRELPPMSNFRQNVMWIDDHLKYALHRELCGNQRCQGDHPARPAAEPQCTVWKQRIDGNVGFYTLGIYLPTVLWGTIVDAWIQPDASFKLAAASSRRRPRPGPWSAALIDARQRAGLDNTTRESLSCELAVMAVRRIHEVTEQWSELEGTLAALWIGDPVAGRQQIAAAAPDMLKARSIQPAWIGWGLYDETDHLAQEIQTGVRTLIDDAVNYIDWTLDWPRFAHAVEALEPGSLAIDLPL